MAHEPRSHSHLASARCSRSTAIWLTVLTVYDSKPLKRLRHSHAPDCTSLKRGENEKPLARLERITNLSPTECSECSPRVICLATIFPNPLSFKIDARRRSSFHHHIHQPLRHDDHL